MKTISVIIEGKVQGVFFRKHTRKKAIELNLTGYVLNRPDGTVYAEASGNKEDIDAFIEWCHKGSPQSQVAKVTVNQIAEKSYSDFEVRK